MSSPAITSPSAIRTDADVSAADSSTATHRRVAGDLAAGQSHSVNLSSTERTASTVIGAGLVAYGLARRGPLGLLLAGTGAAVAWRGFSGHSMAYEAAGVNTADGERPDPSALYRNGVHVAESVTVSRPAGELYDFWRDLTNHPKFMPLVERVEMTDDGRSHWVISGPMGVTFEWDAEVIADEAGRTVSWRTVGGTDVRHAGTARFVEAPGKHGTEVHVEVQYLPPVGGHFLGVMAQKLTALFGQDPARDLRRGLRNFKRLMETGEIPTIEGQPKGSCST